MLPSVSLGPVTINTVGLALIASVWLALEVLERTAGARQQRIDRLYNAAFFGLLVGLLAARLAHIALFFDSYLSDPWAVISISPANFLPIAGLVAGLTFGLFYLRSFGLLTLTALDCFAAPAMILLAGLALANLFSGAGYGLPTSLPWAVDLFGGPRHPTQIYELLAALGVFALLCFRPTFWPFPGGALTLATLLYASARLLIEAFRADSWLLVGDIRGAQVLALIAILAVLGFLAYRNPFAAPTTAAPPASPEGA